MNSIASDMRWVQALDDNTEARVLVCDIAKQDWKHLLELRANELVSGGG